MRKLITAIAVAAVALGAMASGAGAQVQVGSLPAGPPNATGGCELAVINPAFAQPSCTLLAASHQVPRGNWTLTRATVRTGPRTGPMRFVVLRAMRSQAQPPGQPPAGVICCQSLIQSQVFTPPPNQLTTVTVNLPMANGVINMGGEPVEIVDYLGMSILDLNSSLPLIGGQGSLISAFLPAVPSSNEFRTPGTFPVPATPTFAGTVCPAAGQAQNARAHQAGDCPPEPGAAPRPGARMTPFAGTLPRRPATLALPATLTQIQINQRIAIAAIRRLNAINARLAGRPAPTASPKPPARITATTRQLRINQRISEAGYRRAKAIYDRLGGTGATPLRSIATTVQFNRAGVGANQLTNIKTLDMLGLIDAHLAKG